MNLLLSTLLFVSLRALSSWSVSSGTFVVTQSPDVSVMEGEAISITCCWTGTFERVTVQWLKNQTEIKSELNSNQSQGSLKQEANSCSSLIFTKIRTEDSGRYVCRVSVEIPSLAQATGNGTVITVTSKKKKDKGNGRVITVPAERGNNKGNGRAITIKPEVKKDENTDEHIAGGAPKEGVFIYLLRSLPILALITTFFWLYYVGTKAQQKSQAGFHSPGNKAASTQRQEENQEEAERDERTTEAGRECPLDRDV